MLDPEAWQRFKERGLLFHVTPAANVEQILAEGLRPGSEHGRSTLGNFFQPRADRVYLIGLRDLPIVEVFDEPRVIAVELSHLDPERLDPDEDLVAERFPEMVEVAPPVRAMDEHNKELPGQIGARARWADETPGFDRSEVTERCLQEGRVAYRGTIPPEALREVPIPSDPLAAFKQALEPPLSHSLPDVPPRSHWTVEVARALALATETATAVCDALGRPNDAVRLHDYFAVRDTTDALRKLTITSYREDGLEAGNVMHDLMEAIELAKKLEGLAPVSEIDTSLEISTACAGVINKLGSVPGVDPEQVRAIADRAFRAGLDVPGYAPGRAG